MRKITLALLVIMAFALLMVPVVMAAPADTTSDRIETDHDQHGLTDWIAQFDKKTWPGVNLAGDEAYGFYTGTNPGFNGIGAGMTGMTSSPLGAPSYTNPCPSFVDTDVDGIFMPGGCDANADSTDPQTEVGIGVWDIPIVDDLLAKMWNDLAPNDRLTQTLDILFYLDPTAAGVTGQGFIDQTLDQDLAAYTGNIDSFVSPGGVGVLQRLTQRFQLLNTIAKASPGDLSLNTGDDADYIDQYLMSYTKDISNTVGPGPVVGIVSSYSSWFKLDAALVDCPDCTYDFPMGHTPFTHVIPEINDHP